MGVAGGLELAAQVSVVTFMDPDVVRRVGLVAALANEARPAKVARLNPATSLRGAAVSWASSNEPSPVNVASSKSALGLAFLLGRSEPARAPREPGTLSTDHLTFLL